MNGNPDMDGWLQEQAAELIERADAGYYEMVATALLQQDNRMAIIPLTLRVTMGMLSPWKLYDALMEVHEHGAGSGDDPAQAGSG